MLTTLELDCPDVGPLPGEAERIAHTFPALRVSTAPGSALIPMAELPAARWRRPGFDLLACDAELAAFLGRPGAIGLRLTDDVGSARACVTTALEVLTRYQRHLPGRNRHSRTPLFDRILEAHRALHDCTKPLVAADLDHARDTWRWVLRLDPEASLAVQVAALFHDVERLHTESEVRVEQHAPDYRAFKQAHAAAGARFAAATLARLGAESLAARVEELVATHEAPGADPERVLLNDADALSFFSLNACGFRAYYGLLHTRTKVAYTLRRLSARGLHELPGVRLSAELCALVDEALSGEHAGAQQSAPGGPGA